MQYKRTRRVPILMLSMSGLEVQGLNFNSVILTLIISLYAFQNAIAQQVFPGGGTGSYRLDYPGWNYAHHLYAPIGDNLTSHIHKGPNYTGPFQTHQWWSSALWNYGNIAINDASKIITDNGHNPHSQTMYPYPMSVEADAKGFIIRHGFSDINGLNTEIEVHSAVIDARVQLEGVADATETSVDGYGDWHAIFYQNHSGNILRMTAAAGCPFAFFQRTGTARPAIYGLGKNVIRKSTSGRSFIFQVAPEGRNINIGVFFPSGTGVGNNGAPFTPINSLGLGVLGAGWDRMVFDMPPGAEYFTLAVMPNTSLAALDLFESKAFNFITQTNHSYAFNEAAATLTTTFDITTSPVYGGSNTGTLTALYKHQYMHSPEATTSSNTGYTYISPRGNMQLLALNRFQTTMKHQGLLPHLGWANKMNVPQMRAYIDNFLNVMNATPAATDPADGYNKDNFRDFGTIAEIAHQIGYTMAKTKALDALQNRLTDWLVANDDWGMFVYNSNFNFMAHYPNGFTSSGEFIDQHFHVGYMVYAAAVLARFRPAWANQYGGMVETMIRQINDYRKDNTSPGTIGWFPYLRFFDPYAGHSWADPSATNQESVSEALMFNYGVFLWGEATNNTSIRDLGALLYITEAEAAKMYWFDTDHSINYNWQGGTYPQHHMTIVRSRGGSYATFFTADTRWFHSIVIVPETVGTLWMVWDTTEANTMYNDLPPSGYASWNNHGYHYNFIHAGFNPSAAKNAFNSFANAQQWINPTFPHVNGGIPLLYQWVNTFDSVGVYDNSVQANITGFSVFRKGNCKHYMVWMPKGKGPRNVTFTDGRSFLVPDDTLITYKVCINPLETKIILSWLDKEQKTLTWNLQHLNSSEKIFLEWSADGKHWHVENTSLEGTMLSSESFPLATYFRLRIQNTDGRAFNSNVVKNIETTLSSIAYPIPAEEEILVQLKDTFEELEMVSITDSKGQVCRVGLEKESDNNLKLIIKDLPKGMYHIRFVWKDSKGYEILKCIK